MGEYKVLLIHTNIHVLKLSIDPHMEIQKMHQSIFISVWQKIIAILHIVIYPCW